MHPWLSWDLTSTRFRPRRLASLSSHPRPPRLARHSFVRSVVSNALGLRPQWRALNTIPLLPLLPSVHLPKTLSKWTKLVQTLTPPKNIFPRLYFFSNNNLRPSQPRVSP